MAYDKNLMLENVIVISSSLKNVSEIQNSSRLKDDLNMCDVLCI